MHVPLETTLLFPARVEFHCVHCMVLDLLVFLLCDRVSHNSHASERLPLLKGLVIIQYIYDLLNYYLLLLLEIFLRAQNEGFRTVWGLVGVWMKC